MNSDLKGPIPKNWKTKEADEYVKTIGNIIAPGIEREAREKKIEKIKECGFEYDSFINNLTNELNNKIQFIQSQGYTGVISISNLNTLYEIAVELKNISLKNLFNENPPVGY